MRRQGHRGFTLLELIVVLLVFAVLSVMAYGGLRSVLNARSQVETALERTAVYQRSYRKLRDDFQQLRARPIRDGFGDLQPALMALDGEGVVFTRGGWRNPLLAPRATLERVRYRLSDRTLYRDSWRVLDQAQDSAVVELPLLPDVDVLRWRFLDASQEWQDEWSREADGLPQMVELELETADWGLLRWRFLPGLSPQASRVLQSAATADGDLDDAPASDAGDPAPTTDDGSIGNGGSEVTP